MLSETAAVGELNDRSHDYRKYSIFSNLIRTCFCRILKRKKEVSSRFHSSPIRQPHLAFKADWLNNIRCYQCYPIKAPCVKWPFNCQQYKHNTADDSDWVTDSDSVMSDEGESDE